MQTNSEAKIDRHKQIVMQLFDQVWSQGEYESLPELIAPRLLFHFRGQVRPQTNDDVIRIVERWRTAFPDLTFEVEQIVAEGNRAAAQVVYRGTHEGEWKGIPASGHSVVVREMLFFRFEATRIVEVWEVADQASLHAQISAGAR